MFFGISAQKQWGRAVPLTCNYPTKKAWDCSQACFCCGKSAKPNALIGRVNGQCVGFERIRIGGLYLAKRFIGYRGQRVAVAEGMATCRTNHLVLKVRLDVFVDYLLGFALFGLQSPLLDCTVDLAQVVDAGAS